MHSLLARQLRKLFGDIDNVPAEIRDLLSAVDEAYHQFDTDRKMLERSMELSSKELLEANAQLLIANRAAQSGNQAKSTFIANMSHEIRTPMNGILGMTDLLLESELSKEQLEFLDIIKMSGESLLAIINDILDFSKIEANKLDINPARVPIRNYLTKIIKVLQTRAERKGLAFVVHIEDRVPDYLVVDQVRLGQIVLNLIGNAIKFAHTRGGVVLIVDAIVKNSDDVELWICVSDTGVGIAESHRQAIFETFTQIDPSPTRRHGGTGLGLAICKRLVSLMGGTIGVQSKVDVGSAFHFSIASSIPDKSCDEADLQQVETVVIDANVRTLEILVAEDNVVNQKLITKILEKFGHRVTLASNGKEVLDQLDQNEFDLILMDCQMPTVDGFEATAAIRELENGTRDRIPIIAVTAHAMAGDRERCLDAGMDDYLSKPIRRQDLVKIINKYSEIIGR